MINCQSINMNDFLLVFWCLLDAENDIIDLLDNLIRSFPIALKLRSPSFDSARIIQPNFLLFLKVRMSGCSVIGFSHVWRRGTFSFELIGEFYECYHPRIKSRGSLKSVPVYISAGVTPVVACTEDL